MMSTARVEGTLECSKTPGRRASYCEINGQAGEILKVKLTARGDDGL